MARLGARLQQRLVPTGAMARLGARLQQRLVPTGASGVRIWHGWMCQNAAEKHQAAREGLGDGTKALGRRGLGLDLRGRRWTGTRGGVFRLVEDHEREKANEESKESRGQKEE